MHLFERHIRYDPYLELIKQDGLLPISKMPWYTYARSLARESCLRTNTNCILDLGCNTGHVSGWFPQIGIDVIGIDRSELALSFGKSQFNSVDFIRSDLNRTPWKSEKFGEHIGAILLLDVIEHFSETEAKSLLQEVHKLASPNSASIVVSFPVVSPLSLQTWKEIGYIMTHGERPDRGVLEKTHRLFLNHSGHRALFEQNGFTIVYDFTPWSIRSIIRHYDQWITEDAKLFNASREDLSDQNDQPNQQKHDDDQIVLLLSRLSRIAQITRLSRVFPKLRFEQLCDEILALQRMYELRPMK